MIEYTIPQGEGVGERSRAECQTYTNEGEEDWTDGEGEGKCSSELSFEPVLSNGDKRDVKGEHG